MTIIDEGGGIPDFAIERAFERFYSFREAERGKGNGLGLALVKEVVDLHQGSVALARAAEGGTIVTIRLPR